MSQWVASGARGLRPSCVAADSLPQGSHEATYPIKTRRSRKFYESGAQRRTQHAHRLKEGSSGPRAVGAAKREVFMHCIDM